MEFKPKFIEKYSKLTNFEEYKKAVHGSIRKSIRVNTLKIKVKDLKDRLKSKGFELTQVPWCKEGFYISQGPIAIGNLEEHKEGLFFVQASASMIPSLVLNPKPGEIVLDACASPGGKTTHLASLMNNLGLIIANESDRKRCYTLVQNLQRLDIKNVMVTNMSGNRIKGSFDKILLDAPCSASGNIFGKTREARKTLKVWNQNMVKRLAKLQRKLISHSFSLLKPKGTLVYSTCSLEPEEDEQVIESLLRNSDAKLEKIKIKVKADEANGIKMWPQYNNTEGFFISKIRKV